MQNQETLRWSAFLFASFALHAGALAWLDLSGGEIGRLPTTLTVLLESRGENDSRNVAPVPASAVRSRDLFDRPKAHRSEVEPLETVEAPPEPVEQAATPEKVETAERNPKLMVKTEKAIEVAGAPKSEPAPVRTASKPAAAAAVERTPPELDSSESNDSIPAPSDIAAVESASAPQGSSDRAGQNQGQLLSLLHQAISREKRYPLLALRQRREGTTTVIFRLSPSGEMDAIGVDRSSGFGPLDTAAVSAVSRVAPFGSARLFLSEETRFKVDVTFKLN